MPVELLPLLLVAAVAGLALLLGLWQLQVSHKLRREVNELRRQLETRPVPGGAKTNFSASLDQVERQQPVARAEQRSSTEKYRYVASMAAEGMDARGIAAALQLAPAEVEQLLQLARLKQHQ